jgi:hypothetical protein
VDYVTHNHLPAAVVANEGGLMVTYGRYCIACRTGEQRWKRQERKQCDGVKAAAIKASAPFASQYNAGAHPALAQMVSMTTDGVVGTIIARSIRISRGPK